ncbi:MAG: urea transporter [Candidatus Woesearchaeota archaeon]|jgi:urea transporter
MFKPYLTFLQALLKGISQIMLQNNVWTGFLFLIAVLYSSRIIALGALLGVSIGTGTAYLLKYNKKETGIYGVNAAMISMAIFFFYPLNFLTLFLMVMGSIFSVYIAHVIYKNKIKIYTAPFVLIVWTLILTLCFFDIHLSLGNLQASISVDYLTSLTAGFSQILFQTNIITGIIILVGIGINSRINALYAIMGSLFGLMLAVAFSFPASFINIGLFGYNGTLCALACVEQKAYSLRYMIISVVLSSLFMYGMIHGNIIALSAPSIIATWIVFYLKKTKIV